MTTMKDKPKARRGLYRKLAVEIDQENIDRSQQRSSSHCMIADAIKVQHPGVSHVSVDLQTIRFTDPKKGLRFAYLTPPAAQRALVMFDQGFPVEPFSFRVSQPVHVVDAGTKVSSRGKSTRKRRPVEVVARKAGSGRPIVVGGDLPPNAALATTRGRVRVFGMAQIRP